MLCKRSIKIPRIVKKKVPFLQKASLFVVPRVS